jgi:hypothetical protein
MAIFFMVIASGFFLVALSSTSFSSSNGSLSAGSVPHMVGCRNPCTITISNVTFGGGNALVVSSGTTVIWRNLDRASYFVGTTQSTFKLLGPHGSIISTYNHPGTFIVLGAIGTLIVDP